MDKIRKALLENHAHYKTDEEGLNHAESAIDDLERRAEASSIRTNTGNTDVGRGVRRIAENFTSRYIREGGISFIGERVSSPQQLASLMQTYRNPLYETSRIFYIKDEQLVCAESMTNRLPGLVKLPFETYQEEADHITKTMESYGADTFYLLHNHPTGDPTPSFQDRLTTDYIAKHTEGFGGHVIINHARYALVNHFNDYEIYPLEDYQGRDLFTTASLEHPLLDKKIRSSKAIAAIGKQLELTEDTSCFIFLDGSLDVRKLIEVSNSIFSMEDFPKWLREETVRAGSTRSALVTQDENIYENSKRFIEEGYLYDAVFCDPDLPFYWSQKEDAAIRKKEEYIFAGLTQDDLQTYTMKQDIHERKGVWKEVGIAAGKNAEPMLKEKDDFLSNAERTMERMGNRNTEERMTTVVNLFGGPGAGKTTCAWEIAAALKKKGFVTEYVSEYAKDLVWDGEVEKLDGTLQNQKILYKEQLRRVERLIGKVDFIVTDSPTLLSLTYLKEEATDFRQQVTEEFKEGNNFCLVVQRGKKFEQEGRIHNLQQSKVIDKQIKQMLDESQVPYGIYTHEAIDNAVKNMIRVHFARVAEMEKAEEDIKELQSRFSSRDKEYISPVIQTVENKLDPSMQPIVTVIWSEHKDLDDGVRMTLHQADTLFEQLDRQVGDEQGYYKTKFRIDYTFYGELCSYEGRQDLGDGDGGLLDHIQKLNEFELNDIFLKDFVIENQGENAWNDIKESYESMLHEHIPYFREHCRLSQMSMKADRILESPLEEWEKEYGAAMKNFIAESRAKLNLGESQLNPEPKLADFDQSLKAYREKVEREIAQEAAAMGVTIDEYAAGGYEYMASEIPTGNLLTQKVVILDIETTGLDSNTDEILQLSMIDEKGRTLFNEYLKPQRHTSWEDAQRIHHITPDDVKDCQPIEAFLPEINEIIRNADVIVGYNHEYFDIPFLKRAGVIIPDDKETFDVMHKFSPVYGEWDEQKERYKWQKLTTCAEYYGYEASGNFHDSLEDVKATLHCYKAMTEVSLESMLVQSPSIGFETGRESAMSFKNHLEVEI